MKKFIVLLLSFLAYNALAHNSGCGSDDSSNYYYSEKKLKITVEKGLHFEGIGGYNQRLSVSADDYDAASFSVTNGVPYARIKVEATYEYMIPIPFKFGDYIPLNTFLYGGAVSQSGLGTLDKNGQLSNIRVGGAIRVNAKNIRNFYIATPHLRVSYIDY